MMCPILGYNNDRVVDEAILGLMSSILPQNGILFTKFHYAQFLADIIHYQLTHFHASVYFYYQSYLVYLTLYFKAPQFQNIQLKIEDELGNPWSIIEWTSLVRKQAKTKVLLIFPINLCLLLIQFYIEVHHP